MIIDLSSVNNSDYKLEYKDKSEIIINLLPITGYSYIITSMNIFNILQESREFLICDINSEIINITKVGYLRGYECYVDIHMNTNEILLYHNKVEMRDSKLEYLLNDSKLLKTKRIKII